MLSFNEVGATPYKIVITWIRPFDGSVEQYKRFCFDCSQCFKYVEQRYNQSLINYIISKLDGDTFPLIYSSEYTSWTQLKGDLDEHFDIRITDRDLFNNIINLRKIPEDNLFKFYIKLKRSLLEYSKFIQFNTDVKHGSEKITKANESVLNSFILAVGMNLRPLLSQAKPKNLDEAYGELRRLEMTIDCKSSDSLEEVVDHVLNLIEEQKKTETDTDLLTNEIRCQYCDRVGHIALKCFDIRRQLKRTKKQFRRFSVGNSHFTHNPQLGRYSFDQPPPTINRTQHYLQPKQLNNNITRFFNNNQTLNPNHNTTFNTPYNSNFHPQSQFNDFHRQANKRNLSVRAICPPEHVSNHGISQNQFNSCQNQVAIRRQFPLNSYHQSANHGHINNQSVQIISCPEQPKNSTPSLLISIDNQQYPAFIDSGSQINLVRESIAYGRPFLSTKPTKINGFSGSCLTRGKIRLSFSLTDKEFSDIFYVVDDNLLQHFPLYLGSNFFSTNKAIIDYSSNRLIGSDFMCDFQQPNQVSEEPCEMIGSPITQQSNDTPCLSLCDIKDINTDNTLSINFNDNAQFQLKVGDKVILNGKPWSGPYIINQIVDDYLIIRKNHKSSLVKRVNCFKFAEDDIFE